MSVLVGLQSAGTIDYDSMVVINCPGLAWWDKGFLQ